MRSWKKDMLPARIAIVGVGGIGQRHLQSCCKLAPGRYELHVADPSPASRDAARRLVDACGGRPALFWHESAAALPSDLNCGLITTQADVRLQATRQLLERTDLRNLVLEKVLFQRLSEYEDAARLFGDRVHVWVNCPQRLYPAYIHVKQWLATKRIHQMKVTGANWDIGCNAIHFLDLFSFWMDDGPVEIRPVTLTDVRESKRPGNLHLEGTIAGTLWRKGSGQSAFEIRSNPAETVNRTITVETALGILTCTASARALTVRYPGGAVQAFHTPLQSELTAPALEAILAGQDCGLPGFEASRRLHEPMIARFLDALTARGALSDPLRCPVT